MWKKPALQYWCILELFGQGLGHIYWVNIASQSKQITLLLVAAELRCRSGFSSIWLSVLTQWKRHSEPKCSLRHSLMFRVSWSDRVSGRWPAAVTEIWWQVKLNATTLTADGCERRNNKTDFCDDLQAREKKKEKNNSPGNHKHLLVFLEA